MPIESLWQQKSCISRHDIMDIMLEYSFFVMMGRTCTCR
jgi:hypothetical protein